MTELPAREGWSALGVSKDEDGPVLEQLEASDVSVGLFEGLGPHQGVGSAGLHGVRAGPAGARRHTDEDASTAAVG